MTLIQLKNVFFKYSDNDSYSLDIPAFSLNEGDQLFLEGPSGSGKSTFLNILAGLIHVHQGDINILNTAIKSLNQVQKDRFRADHFGIIFQSFNLIPYLSVLENISLPSIFSDLKKNRILSRVHSIEEEAKRLCDSLNINQHLQNTPVKKLSIGQQQRVAIARACFGSPEIIISDEASSALDPQNKVQFLSLLQSECKKNKSSLIFVSHDQTLKPSFDQHLHIQDLQRKIQ